MTEHADRRIAAALTRWAPVLLLAALVLFHAINNWSWLGKNVVIRGWDRIGALVNSLYYHDTLSEISLQSLFRAFTQDQIRPPIFGLSMSFMYSIFGVSTDSAVMVNIVYMAILLTASFGLGARLRDRRLGMLAATLVALIPLLFAMSRYPYFEFSVAAFTTLALYLLLATEQFKHRGFSVLLGLILGLGLLSKRTFPVFTIGAFATVATQAGLPKKLWNAVRTRPSIRWRDPLLALVGGLALAAIWYWPNKETALALSSGAWLFPAWWVLASVTIFALLQPPSTVSNFSAFSGLALSLASLWYLPHSDFVQRLLRAGWGVNDPRGRTVDLTSLSTYTNYLHSLIYGFSPLFFATLLLALSAILIYAVWKRRRLLPTPWWTWQWWSIIVTFALAYLVLSTSIYHEHRAITPLLPALGIVLAGALLNLPWRRLGTILIALTIVFGFVQFYAVSYTETRWLVTDTLFSRPILGQWSIFAQGPYLETPDSEANDPGYWIAPDVLQRVEVTRQREGWDTISLGIIAYSSHVHAGMFAYNQYVSYPNIQLEDQHKRTRKYLHTWLHLTTTM